MVDKKKKKEPNTLEKFNQLELYHARLGRVIRTKRTGNYDFKAWVETEGKSATLELEFSVNGSKPDHDKIIGRAKSEIRGLHNLYVVMGGLAPIDGLKCKVIKRT